MRAVRRTWVPPVSEADVRRRQVTWTLVKSLLALLVLGALLGLAVGFALSRTVDLVLAIG